MVCLMSHAGYAVQAGRVALDLSQAELAERAGVNHGYLSLVEAGHRTPSERWMRTVLDALSDAILERRRSAES